MTAEQPEILYGVPTLEEYAAAQQRAGRRGVLVLPELLRGVFSPELHDWAETPQTWKTLVTQSATPVPDVAADEPEHVNPEDYVTMAEEPIEVRLRRAWLNGFKEGVDRAASSLEDWGRWDS
jgi:hypothetical protein